MGEYFTFENKKIAIYGAASIGFTVYNICKELNISVVGFLDKRGEEISEIQGIKVYNTDSKEIDSMDKNVIVFVAVKDVFEHENIASKLIDKGFNNLIYRPYAVLKGKGSAQEKGLNEIYDRFMNKELIFDEIPKTYEMCKYEYKDCCTIQKEENGRVIYAPIEIVFTDMSGRSKVSRWIWLDIPILALIPHIAFFKWMDKQEGFSYNKYLNCCIDSANLAGGVKITDRWKDNVIKNRANVYYNMNESMDRDPDFFIRNAPDAKWNKNGYFNLSSGKHRASFYVAKGKRFIPLRISEEDFSAWINSSPIGDMINSFQELNVYKVNSPIEHPYFYDFYCENGNLYHSLLVDFIYYIAVKQYQEKGCVKLNELPAVLISLNDDGYISRTLQRYGIAVEEYNKSSVGIVLENLLITKNGICKGVECGYAFLEFKYGKEINFADAFTRKIPYMIWLVCVKDDDEFKKIITHNYSIIAQKEIVKDGERFIAYTLED